MRVNLRPIADYRSVNGIDTGIEYAVQIPGNIPPYEEHDARIKAGYTIPEWYELDIQSRALEVAHYRLRYAVEMAGHDAVENAIKRKGKRRGV